MQIRLCLLGFLGPDIHIKEIDKNYLESLYKIKPILKNWFPKLPFTTTIQVDKITTNLLPQFGYGLLFSGGTLAGNWAGAMTANINFQIAPAFPVPEYPLGALATLGACFAGLLFYKRKSLPHLRNYK